MEPDMADNARSETQFVKENKMKGKIFFNMHIRVYQNAWKSKFQGGGLPKYVVLPN